MTTSQLQYITGLIHKIHTTVMGPSFPGRQFKLRTLSAMLTEAWADYRRALTPQEEPHE